MPAIPESTKTSLAQRLRAHARDHWPQLSSVHVRYRGPFAYVDGQLPDGETLPLMRLRYSGSAARWGFAVYLASKDGYEDSTLPTGQFAGSPHDALDCACDLIHHTLRPLTSRRTCSAVMSTPDGLPVATTKGLVVVTLAPTTGTSARHTGHEGRTRGGQ